VETQNVHTGGPKGKQLSQIIIKLYQTANEADFPLFLSINSHKNIISWY